MVATKAGLSVFEALSFSVLMVAGAAQLTALELMQDNTPTVIIILSALALNLRMALYSASLTPHLGTARFWQRKAAAYVMVDQSGSVAKFECVFALVQCCAIVFSKKSKAGAIHDD